MRRMLETCTSLHLPTGFHMERVQWLFDGLATTTAAAAAPPTTKKYLLYWMQTSVRSRFNYSLEYAISVANAMALPLHVVYFLSDRSVVPPSYTPRDPNAFGAATERQAKFTLEGLACVAHKLAERGLNFQVFHHHHQQQPGVNKPPPLDFWTEDDQVEVEDDESSSGPTRSDLLDLCAQGAALVITDRPYLRPQRDMLLKCVDDAKANARTWGIVQVEGEVAVPCEQVTQKEEYAARTIRPKIHNQLKKYLVPLQQVQLQKPTVGQPLSITLDLLDVTHDPVDVLLERLDVDRSVRGVDLFTGGEQAAQQTLDTFLTTKLAKYATDRNEPSGDGGSDMSLYLRHGQISSVDIALQTSGTKKSSSSVPKESKDSFIEELIVRRELSVNMCVFNHGDYDTMACLPEYATITLHLHASDKREHLYTVDQLEQAQTFDTYWNAAQMEMVATGKMHGYMRMYWAKKILEWTESPQLAFKIALYLNNKYAIDAPDPNSYTGIAWSFGKHDQGWKERPIFGKVRFMNEAGLKRKFKMEAYVAKVNRLVRLYTTGVAPTKEDPQKDEDAEPADLEDGTAKKKAVVRKPVKPVKNAKTETEAAADRGRRNEDDDGGKDEESERNGTKTKKRKTTAVATHKVNK